MTKIEALKQTIVNLIEDKIQYNWTSANNCNCGVVARALLDVDDLFQHGYTTNTFPIDPLARGCFARDAYCITSNIPIPKVFQSLKDAGFSHEDLLSLEYLGDPKICKKAGMESTTSLCPYPTLVGGGYNQKDNLIKYLKAWIEILEEQQVKVIVQPEPIKEKVKETIRYVSVPETLTEKSKELLLVNN